MPEFTSGDMPSPFPNQNILFNSASGITGQQIQQNQLANQTAQLQLNNAEGEQVGRAAAGLLSAYPDEASRAAAYPRVVGMLQSQGLAKHAPPTYPGEGALRALVSQTVPGQTQAEWLQNLTANRAYTNAGNTASTGAPGTTTGAAAPSMAIPARGTGGPGASASAPTEWLPYFEEASKATGIPVDLLIAQTRQESGFNPNAKGAAGEVGLFQIKPSTASSPGFGMTGVDPTTLTGPDNVRNNIMFGAQYLKARMGGGDPSNPAVQAAGLHAYNGGGDPNYVGNVFRYRPTLAPSDPNAAVTTYTPGGGTVPTGGVAARTGGTDTAGPGAGPVAPLGSTAAPGGPTTAAAPAPGATTAAAPTQPQATPAGSPAPPQLQPVNANGLTDVQQRQVNALAANPQTTLPQRMAAEQAFRNQNIQLQQKQFSDWVQVQQLQTSQGQLSVSQQNSALEYWKAAHPDAKVTMTGGEIITQDPRNGQEIAPRIQVTPQRADTAAMAIVSRLGPKVANGSATPEEQAQYAVAVDSYRQPVLRENPLTKETVRVNTRELPTGFPEPPSLGGSAAPGGTSAPGGPQTVMPGLTLAQQEAEREFGKAYATTDRKSYDAANASLGMLVNANNAAEVLNRNPGSFTATGSGANTRLELGKTLNTVSGLFGGGPVVDPSQISAWEALNKQTKLMGMQVINNYFGGSREAASIINGATTAVPNSENSYLGFRLVSSGIEQDLQRQRELYEFKGQHLAAGKPLATAEAEFNKANPVENYTARAIANAVPDDIASHLAANPDTVKAFDQHFGPGIGEFILKGGRTGMGRAGVPSNG